MNQRHTFALATVCFAVFLGLGAQGCSARSGHSVPVGSPSANLEVTNHGSSALVVYVDRVQLGTVQPNQTRAWDVFSGSRPVHMREVGDSILTYYGQFNFSNGALIAIDYQPGVTQNLTVYNDSSRTLDVYVDLVQIGDIPPREHGSFLVNPGQHDIYFREHGSSIDFVGTFDFPFLTDDQELVLVYQP